jgi:two-component system, NarL family, nitrate/nitrite response regulator NarL
VTLILDAQTVRTPVGAPVLVMAAHQLLGETLQLTLAYHGVGVEVSASPRPSEVLDEVLRTRPRVVLLDLELTGIERGTDLIRPITDQGCKVLVLAGAADRIELARCLEAGALGVLSKASSFQTVLDAIRSALAGETVTPVSVRAALLAELCQHRQAQRSATARFDDLSPRERCVLAAIVDGQCASTIAERSYVSLATVRTQIRSILQKLGVNSQLAAAALARNSGWTLTGETI